MTCLAAKMYDRRFSAELYPIGRCREDEDHAAACGASVSVAFVTVADTLRVGDGLHIREL